MRRICAGYAHKKGDTMNNALMTQTQIIKAEIGGDLFGRFLRYLDAKPKTIETYTRALRQLAKYFLDNGITQPKREDVIAFRDELKASHKPTTVQNYITVAKLFFRWTAQEGLYPNIADHIKGARLDPEHKKDYLTSGQVKAVLQRIDRGDTKGKRDYAMLTLMITGGLRTIEVSRADIADLRTLGDHAVLYVQGKGSEEKAKYIRIAAAAEQAIRDYLKARGNTEAAEPLFTSTSNHNGGGRLTTRAISGIVKTRLVNAGYDSDRLTAHSLRHTAVTLSLLAGRDLTEVQEFARHSNLNTTMIYNHALEYAKNGCSEAIAALIFAV